MKIVATAMLILCASLASFAQDNAQKIYDTERSFERAVAEKGINAGFIEFLSPVGVMFDPEIMNGREMWKARPASPAALTWNPIKIEVSSNGALAYSIGNSIYKPKGKSDTEEYYGHYITVWARQPNGEYLAALDAGINHEKPVKTEPTWTSGPVPRAETHPRNLSAGDASVGFFQMAETRGLAKAYKAWGADDLVIMRDGQLPFVGRDLANDTLGDQKSSIRFAKRRSFLEAGGLAYVYSTYSTLDEAGKEKQKGNFVQVWKLRGGKWLIAADIFIVIPPAKN